MRAAASTKKPIVLCFTEGFPTSWRWFEGRVGGDQLDWRFFHSIPRNRFEAIKRPKVGRYAEALRASWCASREDASLVVSFGPQLAWSYEEAARFTFPRAPHITFTFNFPTLPRGFRRDRMRRAFQSIDRFVVFSTVEKQLYAEYFDISPTRIDMTYWGVQGPRPSAEAEARGTQPYVCAVGGNGRDYATLIRTAQATPEVPYVFVVRPANVAGMDLPPNVKVEVNVPVQRAWDIIYNARFMVLPLADSDVPCGHVTIVNAMYFKKAFVITDSPGVHDYAIEGLTALRVPPRDPDAMAAAVLELWNDPARAERIGLQGYNFARRNCSEERMMAYVQRCFAEKGLIDAEAVAEPVPVGQSARERGARK